MRTRTLECSFCGLLASFSAFYYLVICNEPFLSFCFLEFGVSIQFSESIRVENRKKEWEELKVEVPARLRKLEERISPLKGKTGEETSVPNESGVIICSNPSCRSKFEEPILVNNLSATPTEQYRACPRCFTKLGGEAHLALENVLEVMHESMRRRRDRAFKMNRLLRAQSLKKKEEPRVESPGKEEERPSLCLHSLGYLASRPENVSIPEECLICSKLLECMRR